jgi:hypothetical protein
MAMSGEQTAHLTDDLCGAPAATAASSQPPTRSFMPAIKEQDEGGSDYKITKFALKKRKKELISQLKGSDEHGN